MFVINAKLTKARLGVIIASALALLVLLLALTGGGEAEASETIGSGDLKTNEERVAYLSSLGWQVEPEPLSAQEIRIPKEEEWDQVYVDYAAFLEQQGFDLKKYAGRRVRRYTYTVTNYPGGESATATLLIYKNKPIGGEIVLGEDGSRLTPLIRPAEEAPTVSPT